ncbi:hypothetical protein, partial [Methyloglobulus morosus]|uniref:hypothetical protein n=1 Tax=Methyloglobulus morosus TaxID=1410681 RepID=UPI0005689FCA
HESTIDNTLDADSLLSKIELPKIVDLIVSKQTQYYTLWAVYTAVQFAAGNYGFGHTLSLVNGLAVFFGVWAFNLGHLNFLLRCADQLEKLRTVLIAALDNNNEKYQSALHDAFRNMSEVGLSERARQGCYSRAYFWNRTTGVHLFIDLCASVALLIRVS